MHNEKVEERKSQHIKCPICSEERKELLANHDSLIQHLTKVHSVSIEQYNFSFRNIEELKLEEHRKVEKWIMLILQV
jgi:C4-type Zn-finger protein